MPIRAADLGSIESKQADVKIESFVDIDLREKRIILKLDNNKIQLIGRNNKDKYYHALLYNRNYYRCYDSGHCTFKYNRGQARTIILAPSYLDKLKDLYNTALSKGYSKK